MFVSSGVHINSQLQLQIQLPCPWPSRWCACQYDHTQKSNTDTNSNTKTNTKTNTDTNTVTLSLAITVMRLSAGSLTKTVFPSADRVMPLAPMKLKEFRKEIQDRISLLSFKDQKYFRADIVSTFLLLLTHRSPLSHSIWTKYVQSWSDNNNISYISFYYNNISYVFFWQTFERSPAV